MAAYTTIDNPELYFQVKLYTGNGSTQTITLDNTDADLDPDLIWVKKRSGTHDSVVVDTVRGVTKVIETSTSDAEATWANGITAISTDSFALGDSGANNDNTETFVAWCWKESADSGMDIVSYTGNGSARTISHSLSAVPKMIIVKDRDDADYSWHVYHEAVGNGKTLYLDLTNAPDTNSIYWNNTSPTSSVFSVGTSVTTNKSSDDFIAYLFAPKQGYSAMGSYTGNGNADGPYIHLGFRPAWIMTKISSGADDWQVCDNKRDPDNAVFSQLMPNSSDAQNDGDAKVDFLSNGFKIRKSGGSWNGSGSTFIYMAFAEAPFVNSKGVPCNAR